MKSVTVSKGTEGRYWIKRYEFEGMKAEIKAVALMLDGDMVIAGSIKPEGKDSKSSGLVARLDREGNVKWVRILGGNERDGFNDVKIASNSDIIVAGYTESFGAGGVWVLRLDENGNVEWQKTYGGEYSDGASAVAVAPNGDIIVVGWTDSFDTGGWDFWVLRLDSEGNVKWQKTYGGSNGDWANAVALADNGDIIVAGWTESFGANPGDTSDVWVLRLDANGNVKWQKTYRGSSDDDANAVALAPNGDIIVAGYTESFGAGAWDAWVLRLDSEGNVKWQKTYGGSDYDGANAVALAPNGDVIVAGHTFSFGAGDLDPWVLRLDSEGNVKWQKTLLDTSSFNSISLTPEGDIIAVGSDYWRSGTAVVAKIPPDGELPNCDLWKGTNAMIMDTQAAVKNTNCKVTVPPLKPDFSHKEYVKITGTNTTIRTAIPRVKVLCEWEPGEELRGLGKTTIPEPNEIDEPSLIRYYAVRLALISAQLDDKEKLIELLEDLKELSKEHKDEIEKAISRFRFMLNEGIPISQSALDELKRLLHKIEIETKVAGYSDTSKTGDDEAASKSHIEISDSIKHAIRPDTLTKSEMSHTNKQSKIKAGAILKVPEVTKSKFSEGIKTLEGFPPDPITRYGPLEFLGEGGFAKVFRVKRRKDGKIVALKIPRIDEKTSSLFIKEVAAWYNLNHDNIVRLYKADILPVPYLEMEFVEGVKVDGKLVRDLDAYPKPVDEKTALRLIEGIARGLAHAHSKGIYHLDLKPLNVLLKADLTPKITDWGLAKISARSSLTQHYGYSPLYAAPEQLDEGTFGMPDHRTDIYQLGLIFYELLTGELPYKATSPGALVGKILYSKPKPVSEIKPELKKFDGVFEKLLAKKKEDRYQSVEEFLSALNSLGELEREKEELRKTTLAMKRSKSREEFERLKVKSIRQTVAIAVLSAKLNDKALLLEALDDLRFYTRENFEDLVNLIAQVEMLTREGIPISGSLAEKIEVLVRRIEGEVLR